jgi:hypothetical protein
MGPRTATLRMPQRRSGSALLNRKYTSSGASSFPRTVKFSAREAAAAFLALLFVVLGLWTGYAMKEIAADLAVLEKEASLIGGKRQELLAEEGKLRAPETLKALGERLGLHPPAENQVIHLK